MMAPADPPFAQAQGLANANEGHPTVPTVPQLEPVAKLTAAHRMQAAGKNTSLREHVQPHVDQGGDDARNQPCAGQGANEQQDQNGPDGIAQGVLDVLLEQAHFWPRHMPMATASPEASSKAI